MKSSISRQIGKYENEASRRLYRGAADASRKLEQELSLASNLTDLFSSKVIELRVKLKEYCERLMFTDPLEYGKKAEDLLWRRVYYDFFYRCKQNRKKLIESHYYRNSLISHLLAGIGFYHHILLRIQTEFHIELEGKVDVPFLWHLKGVKKERWKKYQQSAASDNNVKNWANQACHRILIYLGDLERYIAELNVIESTHLSERYYDQAFCLNSQNGTPHNQLGSLYNNGFDSGYHYMRCLSCQEKFDGAEGNLKRVFEKNDETMKHLYSNEEFDSDSSFKCSKFLCRFLKLCEIFYFTPGENSEIYCQGILKEFDINLNSYSNEVVFKECDSSELQGDKVFKMVVMSLMCVTKLQEIGHADVSVATAFCLALFSYVVDRATKFFLYHLHEMKSKVEVNDSNLKQESPSLKSELYDNIEANVNKDIPSKKPSFKRNSLRKLSSRRLRTLRRRRKMSSTSQEDSELSDVDINEDELNEDDLNEDDLLESDEESVSETGSCSSESLSENEDDALIEEINAVNENNLKKETIDDFIACNGREDVLNGLETNEKSNKNENIHIKLDFLFDDPGVSADKLIQLMKRNDLLMCLKVLSDWLRINEDILSACMESSQILLSRVIELLNLLLKIDEKLRLKDQFSKYKCNVDSWKQTYPLPEDIVLQELPFLKEIHSNLSFDIANRRELSSSCQGFIRLQCLLSFAKCLMRASESSVDFDVEKKKYYFNLSNKVKDSSKDNRTSETQKNCDTETQRQNLMRSMAHLWLKAEVNDLENLVEDGASPQLSPYLVVDTSVLCHNLMSLKQLIASKRFIVIVPLVVIANLDQLKKESIGAREAIRWLETELRKGCRFIRAQCQMEKISLVPMKYPRKKDKEAWNFFQILECCNYLVQQQMNGKTGCSLVTLLVGSKNHLPENAIAIAQSIDVAIQSLGVFFLKWKNSLKNPG